MFKTEAIILSVEMIRDNNIRIVCLTKDYGKISAWYKKKQFQHDMGDIIFATIDRVGTTNIIKYTESIMSPREESWNYAKLRIFLESIAIIYTLTPEESPYTSIFQDYRGLLIHMQSQSILHEHHYLLFQFRVLRTLGYVGSESFSEAPIALYIFTNILTTPLSKLLSAKELKDEDAQTIGQANREALHRSSI